MPYVGYVEFMVPDHRATAAFYRAVFGWEATEVSPEYLSVPAGEAPGIDTGIGQSSDDLALTVATVMVEDLDAAIARVEQHGGVVHVPRFSIPGVGYACYFRDINGMTVGIWEADSKAV